MDGVRRYPAPRRALATAIIVLVAALLPASVPAAGADEATVTFNGAGWGHGVGLSQYGAYGASRDGWTADQILEHFFQGSTIGTMGEDGIPAADPLWVNLERDRTDLELIARNIVYVDPPGPPVPVVVSWNGESKELARDDRLQIHWNSDAGTCDFTVVAAADGAVTDWGTGACGADITWDGWVEQPTRKIEIAGCTQTNWNTSPVSYPPCQYGRGDLHLRVGPGGMDLSVAIDINDYVLGISEMPYYWGLPANGGYEALKAQAIAARSYARELQIYRGEPGDNSCAAWCHVRDTTFDQRYVGWGHGGDGQDEWIDAVRATDNQVLVHPDAPNGQIVRTYYSSSTGGATESAYEIWDSFDAPIEYYTSADDHWSLDPSLNGNASWTREFSASYVAGKLGWDELLSATVVARNTSTSARTVRFTGIDNGVAVEVEESGSWVKSTFGLKSTYFSVGYGEPSPFSDIVGSVHYDDIAYIAAAGITKGCNPPDNTKYCPDGTVTRGQMAAFLVRALGLTDDGGKDWFGDDDGLVFEEDINRLAAAGITVGCNAAGTDFCPDDPVSRGEMAAFLVRGFGYGDAGAGDWFADDDGSIFEGDIDRLRVAGVTYGCNPPDNDQYCPLDPVRRDQMASFLARALQS
jgi:SpoIID/LytB domain protein